MKYPASIQRLIDHLAQWPTVGPKTAERFAFFLIKQKPEYLINLANSLVQLQKDLGHCDTCQMITTSKLCPICSDTNRNVQLLCIVADNKDLIAIENSGHFKGRYHVLNGTISSFSHNNNLTIKQLLLRLAQEPVKEIIIALNPDLEGETTALYLRKLLANKDLTITRLARGLPAGSSLDYADPMTLGHALNYRNKIN